MPYASFLRDYLVYAALVRVRVRVRVRVSPNPNPNPNQVYAAQHGLAPSGPRFYDGLRAFLAVTQPFCIAASATGDAPCAGTPAEAQRLVVPAT